MYTKHIHRIIVLAALTTPLVHAGSEETTAAAIQPAKKSIFSGDLGVTTANQYNTRGIVVQDDDVTFQPYLNIYAKYYEGQGFVKSSSLFLGLWADVSTNGNVSGPGNPGSSFTEFDYGLGLTFSLADHWTFTTFYNQWTSPADGYGDGRWWNGTLSYDDTGLLAKNFAISPYLIVLRDLGGDAATGLEKNTWYFEPGIRPNYTFFADSQTPLNVAFLIKAGLGDGFYDGETYGYLALGPQISTKLGFIDPSLGKWSASIGYLYYDLGDTLAPIKGSDHEDLFTFNIAVSF